MGAAERLSLLIDTRTSGDSEVDKLERAINRVIDKSVEVRREMDGAAETARNWAVTIGLVAAAGKVLNETAQGAMALGRAYTEARGRAGVLLDTYRALNISIAAAAGESALMFAGTTLAAGLVVERLAKISSGYAKLIEQNAILAAQTKASFSSVQTFATASIVSGKDLSFLNAFDPDKVREYISELENIPDPIDRASRATEIFGKDAARAYELIGTNISNQIQDAQELTAQIDGPTRASIQRMRGDFQAFENFNPFDRMLIALRLLREDAKQGITIRVAAVFDFVRGLAGKLPTPPGEDFTGSGGELGPGLQATQDERSFLPSLDDFRRMLPSVVGSSNRFVVRPDGSVGPAAPGMPRLSTAAQVAAAGGAVLRRENSLESLRSQLSAAQASAGTLAQAVASGGPLAETSAISLLQTEKQITALQRQIKEIENLRTAEERLAALRKSVGQDVQFAGLTPVQRRQAEAVAEFGGGVAGQFNPLLAAEQRDAIAKLQSGGRQMAREAAVDADREASQTLENRTRLFQFNLSRAIATDTEFITNARRLISESDQLAKRRLDLQVRAISLLTGPGGELAAVRQIADIRIAAARTEEERADAILDREEKIKAIKQKQIDDFRESSGRVFDALLQGPSGIRSLVLGTLGASGRTAFQNVSQEFLTGTRGKLALPGQTNEDGSLNLFGRILKGTPFGVDTQKQAVDANTAATNLNTQAILAASGAGAGGGGSASGLIGRIGSALGIPASVFGGAGSNPMIFSAAGAGGTSGLGAITPVPGFVGVGQTEDGTIVPMGGGVQTGGATSKMSATARGVGIAGALAGGTFGVVSGVKQGGIRGATTAIGSAAGSAAALLPLIGLAGPAAPILAGVALAAAMIPAFLPDPRKQRESRIDKTLESAAYISPAAMNYAMTTSGQGFDYNRFGAMRPIVIQQTFQAMDAKNIIDRRGDIAEGVRLAMQEAHGLNEEIMGVVRAA